MKIRNNGSDFKITYDSKEYEIKKGEMEVTNEGFATFILKKARAWGLDVVKTGISSKELVQPIEAIKEVKAEKEDVKEDVKEEVKAEKEDKKKTKK